MAGVAEFESVIAEYYESLEKFAEQQEKVLEHILTKDSNCEYLRRHGFRGQTDVKTFKELLPVIEYDAIEQDMKRIAEGDTSGILTCEEVTRLAVSSGTSSGKRKVLPVTGLRQLAMGRQGMYVQAFISRTPVGKAAAGLSLCFWTAGKIDGSPGGLPIAVPTTFFFNSPQFKQTGHTRSSPHEVILCTDIKQSTYCHLLCGLLRSSEVTNIGAILASGLAFAFSLFKELWSEISRDIETGELSSLVSDPSARAAVSKLLAAPNPELAQLVRAECGKASWEGIILRLWPQARYIHCITTGTMAQYVDYINFLTSAQLPLSSSTYVGSEGCYGFNPCLLNPPQETFYVMVHNQNIYFEFLRVRRGESKDNEEEAGPVDLAGVKEGQEYELIVTNGEGLWRYKVGDVLQCVGFYHQAPKFKFIGRKNVILSIHTDKTEEKELLEVVNKAAKQHLPANAYLCDFTSCPSLDAVPGHYVIFWEIGTKGSVADPISLGEKGLAEACFTMEAGLSEPYRRGRNNGVIAPLELRIVRPGTFDKITRGALNRGITHYKVPRGLKAGNPDLAILNAAVAETGQCLLRLPPHPTLNPAESVSREIEVNVS